MSSGGSANSGLAPQRAGESALSFVVCVGDDASLRANLLASPCLGSDAPHEVIAIPSAPSAAAGLNTGLSRARNDLVVCVHQDVYLPRGWDRLMTNQYRMAEREFGLIGVAGVYGVGEVIESRTAEGWLALAAQRIGWVVDRGRILSEGPGLPARVATLDELILIVRRDTPLRFDPALGFHLYGADVCLQARECGLAVIVLGAPCHHNSRNLGLPEAFFASARVFARKWANHLPLATPCVVFDRDGEILLLGNAATETAMARAECRFARGTDSEPPMTRGEVILMEP